MELISLGSTASEISMKIIKPTRFKKLILFASMTLSVVMTAQSKDNTHPAANIASPDNYEILLKNDSVLVLEMVLNPGDSDSMHHHNNETVYFEKGGNLRITTPDGDTKDFVISNGHVMWHPAWSHQVTNIGESTVKAIIVEDLKNSRR